MTSRRNFLRNLLVAGASFAVLPPASTYDRIWRAQRDLSDLRFIAAFKYYTRPMHLEFARVYFHKRNPNNLHIEWTSTEETSWETC